MVDVVLISVLGRAHRNHSFQGVWRIGAGLKARRTAPGRAEHANASVAPGLLSNPADHMAGVGQFVGRIHVCHQPFTVTGAAHVNAQTGIAVRGQERMIALIAGAHHVTFAIGNNLKDRRHRRVGGTMGQPKACCQASTIRHADPDMLNIVERGRRRAVHHGNPVELGARDYLARTTHPTPH